MGALEGGHRADHRLDPVELTLVEVVELGGHLAHARHHLEHRLQRAHPLDRGHLLEEVVEGEVLLGEELALHLLGLAALEGALGLLDERQDVTHVEDPAGHAVGVEDLDVLGLLAGGGEHDRPPRRARDGQRGTTSGVTVELRQDDTGEVDALGEGPRGLDGRLADHRVDDEEDLVGLDRRADVGGLLHELGVDGEAAGGVDDDDVVVLGLRVADAGTADRDRVTEGAGALARLEDRVVAAGVAALRREDRDARTLTGHLELGDGIGALQVGRDEQRGVALLLEPGAELAGEGRLAGALEAGQHDDRRRPLGELDRAGVATEDRHELVVDDLDDLLGGVEGLAHLRAGGTLAHRGGELLDDRQRHVCVDERHPDVPDGLVDVGLGQAPLAAEVLEGRGQAVGQAGEHPAKVICPRRSLRHCLRHTRR